MPTPTNNDIVNGMRNMEFCLSQGSQGPEIGMLVDNLRILGFDLDIGTYFSDEVAGALRMFQQSYHDHLGRPLKIDGRLGTATALALDRARDRSRKTTTFDDSNLQAMSQRGSALARRAASVGYDEYMRACGEQGGDNLGPDIARYQGISSQRGAGWSVDFAAYCYREAFGPNLSPFGFAHTAQDLIEKSEAKGWLLSDVAGGFFPGDLVVWDYVHPRLRDHLRWRGQVGIVWNDHEGTIITLEGDRGPYPSLVRPYRHKVNGLLRTATNGQLRNGIAVLRVQNHT